FLQRCVARNGIFLWGNHYYWHAGLGQTVKFVGEEQPYPVQLAEETGDYHEVRPIPPAWEIFWKLSAGAAEKEIRTFVTNSLFDQQGGFNRHADGKKGCAFLESGGIMVVSLAYLYRRIKNPALLELADKIVDFSFSHRHEKTGLLENNPTQTRWDKFVSTTEIGLWASCLLKAVELTGRQKWLDKARAAVRAYLSYGYEEATGKYLGQLLVDTGTSPFVTPCSKIAGNAIYQPGRYSEPWRQFFPSHDYPLQMAETCLELYRLTGEEIFRVACQRWAEQMMKDYQECRQQGRVFYAERYGRCLHFLWRCSQVLGEKEYLQKASFLAEEALASLWQGRMFRSHTGEDRYQAVDGLGYLFLSLLCLELNEEVEMMGTFW
ncbi:MAG TPA: hypothetical protein PKX93_09430, partial [bacterium]|nr:hypothetical protein [bacterium]